MFFYVIVLYDNLYYFCVLMKYFFIILGFYFLVLVIIFCVDGMIMGVYDMDEFLILEWLGIVDYDYDYDVIDYCFLFCSCSCCYIIIWFLVKIGW